MITVFERELYSGELGSKEGKISFLQNYPNIVRFSKTGATFNVAGLFQIPSGPPVLVLPWFLKGNKECLESKYNGPTGEFFELINEIKTFISSSVDLQPDASALDIILHSYLLNLFTKLNYVISNNFHQDVSDEINVIKGRWNTVSDLRKGLYPVKFNCTFNSLEKSVPVLVFFKAFAKYLRTTLRAKKNLILADQIFALLKDVEDQNISESLIRAAKSWVVSNKQFAGWEQVCEFAESLIIKKSVYAKDAGLSYQFQMDKFFEALVFKLCRGIDNAEVHTQTREDVLGGARWVKDNLQADEEESKNAIQISIPDIVMEFGQNLFVLECKYKPFKIPFLNEQSLSTDLVRYGRNDRNQLLSFLLSLRPSPTIGKKHIKFAVLFPCREISRFSVSSLVFSSAKLQIDPIARNIIQNKNEFSNESRLSVQFIGLNISELIGQMLKKDRAISQEFLQLLRDDIKSEMKTMSANETPFQTTLEKRVALSSLIVNEGKNDKSLGRVKLAKVFYLLDSHLNLNMQAQYYREAMGPLDARLIYNEKIGIEKLGEKNAFFKCHEIKRENGEKERMRYSPGANMSIILAKAPILFADKIENIVPLIRQLLPLNTDQSEIVATLYACWNDQILSGKEQISDEDIVSEFQQNWHPAKKRFEKEKLFKALGWMREIGLVPVGLGSKTQLKMQSQASGF